MDAFETAFNAACEAIARGELGRAAVLLKRAEELGSQIEDMDEEERRLEVAPVVTQGVYVLARLERWGEALERSVGLGVERFVHVSRSFLSCEEEEEGY
jgi:signal recognition particle subunit SRP72